MQEENTQENTRQEILEEMPEESIQEIEPEIVEEIGEETKQETNIKQESQKRNWYVIQTAVGYENAVERNLRQRIESLGMHNTVFDVMVPVEKKVKVRNGKKYEVEEKFYPGYLLVDMIVTDDSWYMIRNTPRVHGFVGSGNTPVPISKEELDYIVNRVSQVKTLHEIAFEVNDAVTVNEGPFKDFEGKISEIDRERGRIKAMVNMFGRETSIELDFNQVSKI